MHRNVVGEADESEEVWDSEAKSAAIASVAVVADNYGNLAAVVVVVADDGMGCCCCCCWDTGCWGNGIRLLLVAAAAGCDS